LYYEKIDTCDKVYIIEAFVYIVGIVIAAFFFVATAKLCRIYNEKIKFFLTGFDSSFSLSEIRLLWKTAKLCNIEQPLSLYWSLPSLTKCLSQIKSDAEENNNVKSSDSQRLLTKLYSYRTKIEKESDKNKGIGSTRSLEKEQRLRIILQGKGVFLSRIVNNGRELTISLPTQKGIIPVEGKDWIGKTINIYLWRKGDARYVFDTVVLGEGLFLGRPSLFLHHTEKLLRTQKRNSIRAQCRIYASLFILKDRVFDFNAVETKPGYRCLIEDISEAGAMVRIGGMGVPNIQMKLQFTLDDKLIIMFGIIRTTEYNKTINQSRLHFECIHIEPPMKNEILSFVYNIMPLEEKEIYDAIALTNEDQSDSGDDDSKKTEDNNGKKKEDTYGQTDDFLPNLPRESKIYLDNSIENRTNDSGPAVINTAESVQNDTLNEV
jgi:c-di-GMP-binding flagellar brake protein YcgR